MMAELNDEQLADGFSINEGVSVSEMSSLVDAIAPTLPQLEAPKGMSKQQLSPARQGKMPATSVRGKRGMLGGGRGGSSHQFKRGPQPMSGGIQKQLDHISAKFDSPSVPDAPLDDVATAAEIETMSMRSSKLEQEVGDLSTELSVAMARIDDLEISQGALTSKYTEAMKELSMIKEMLREPDDTPTESTTAQSKVSSYSDGNKASNIVRAPQAASHHISSESNSGPNVEASDSLARGSRIKKKKF